MLFFWFCPFLQCSGGCKKAQSVLHLELTSTTEKTSPFHRDATLSPQQQLANSQLLVIHTEQSFSLLKTNHCVIHTECVAVHVMKMRSVCFHGVAPMSI